VNPRRRRRCEEKPPRVCGLLDLPINGAGHAHAQKRDNRHQDQQPDGDAKDLDPDRNVHGRLRSP